MFRLFIVLLLCFSCTIAFPQLPGAWAGHSEYLAEDSSGSGASGQKLSRFVIMQINPDGLINGTVRVHYDRLTNARLGDLQNNFLGRWDPATQKMVLALQVPKLRGPKPYYKADSIYYSYTVTQLADSLVMLLQADNKKNILGFEYQTDQKSYQFSMLPTRMRIVYTKTVPLPAKDRIIQPAIFPGAPLPARDKEIQHTIFLDTSSIRIDLYDNGEIDNDSVTLLLDGKTVVRSQPLTDKAVSLSLELSKEPAEHLLEMFADNLGSIPPNTALLVLTCNRKRYELNLSSNRKVNGSVKLVVRR
ncbi:MAG: hypothetical protein JO301_11590 [Chitinophagaceae bacterium]|nr:hypothetical protein [Chitinophagaceae bacterium]